MRAYHALEPKKGKSLVNRVNIEKASEEQERGSTVRLLSMSNPWRERCLLTRKTRAVPFVTPRTEKTPG